MKIEDCINFVDELIKKLDNIISIGALIRDSASIDIYRDIRVQMRQLIRTLFSDADKRIKDEDESIGIAANRDGPMSIRTSFLEQVKATRRYLISIKDSLKLRESIELKEDKLDKLREQVNEKEVEAERREKVTETKFYGAAIEIIDRLRDQLKDEGDIKQEILTLKGNIKEVIELLREIKRGNENKEPPSKSMSI